LIFLKRLTIRLIQKTFVKYVKLYA
jgi:hypothetical protein